MSSDEENEPICNLEDTFRILISTDNHLGYMEKDAERFDDSFISFEEVLASAEQLNPDFALLGGDLFHENRPSLKTIYRCIELFRKYTLSDKPVSFQMVSNQAQNFSHSKNFSFVNYEDENLNVGLPVFSIHGNHDDPLGPGGVCALDLMHASGLVNLFGKVSSVEKIQISPLLLRKGSTNLALYGLGSCRDERLHRMMVDGQVEFLRPVIENDEEWFNLLVLHQNRVKHGDKNYIPESFLPDFLHLVIWGHEHDCRIEPEWNASRSFYISQPGSSVATSLSEGESGNKCFGLLEIHLADFRMKKIKLKTIRPFIMSEFFLDDEIESKKSHQYSSKAVEDACTAKIESMIQESQNKLTGNPKQPTKPLIRLRVDYSGGYETFSAQRFGQRFMDRVANPKDLILFHRKREKTEKTNNPGDISNVKLNAVRGNLSSTTVEALIKEFFIKAPKETQLSLLTERELTRSLTTFVDKGSKDAISDSVKKQISQVKRHLDVNNVLEENIKEEISRFKDTREVMEDDDNDDTVTVNAASLQPSTSHSPGNNSTTSNKRGRPAPKNASNASSRTANSRRRGVISESDDDEEVDASVIETISSSDDSSTKNSSAPSRGRGRGGRGSRGRGRGANSKPDQPTKRGGRGGGGSTSKRSKAVVDINSDSSQEESVSFNFKRKKKSFLS